jgi:hypothetical protein
MIAMGRVCCVWFYSPFSLCFWLQFWRGLGVVFDCNGPVFDIWAAALEGLMNERVEKRAKWRQFPGISIHGSEACQAIVAVMMLSKLPPGGQ